MTEEEKKREALELIKGVENAMAAGNIHIRKSDNKELHTVREILEALLNEGAVLIQLPPEQMSG